MTSFKMGLYVSAAILCSVAGEYSVAVCDGRTLRDKLMYPWGPHEGDQSAYRDWLVLFNNTESIRYFRNQYSDVYLCPGGRIGFSSIADFRCGIDNSQIPHKYQTSDWTNIAAFGVTHNLFSDDGRPNEVYMYFYNDYKHDCSDCTFKTEKLWFRVTRDETLLSKASNDAQKHFQGCHQNFKPKELFIATWSDAHDVDFCETHQLEELLCSCVIEAPFISFNSHNLQSEPGYLLCTCIHEYQHSARYCTCYVTEKNQHYYDYLHDLYNVSYSWCECLHQNDYDEDFCDCQIDNICSEKDKRQLPPMKRKVEETNSYQMVIMTDGRQSYAMFNYLDINWIYVNTYGIVDPYPYYYDPLRIYAEVGFEQENGPYYHHPYSASDDLYKLGNETNTGMPGRWMYKISGHKIKGPGCVQLPFGERIDTDYDYDQLTQNHIDNTSAHVFLCK